MPVIKIRSLQRRGECRKCGFSFRLCKDGTVGTHHLYSGQDRYPDPCEGSRKPPPPLRFHGSFPLCMECGEFAARSMLIEAVYSVCIETGGDPQRAYENVLNEYHWNRHQET